MLKAAIDAREAAAFPRQLDRRLQRRLLLPPGAEGRLRHQPAALREPSLRRRARKRPRVSPGDARATARSQAAERQLLADVPLIPLYFYVSKHLVAPRVEDWYDNVMNVTYSKDIALRGDGALKE